MGVVLRRMWKSHGDSAKREEKGKGSECEEQKRIKRERELCMCVLVCVVMLGVGAIWQRHKALEGVEAYSQNHETTTESEAVYSLWLTPSVSSDKGGGGKGGGGDESAGDVLAHAIRETAKIRRTPSFPPHVTLAASFSTQTQYEAIDATRRVAALPEFANGMRCAFERRDAKDEEDGDDSIHIEAGASFFQSVYAVVEKTPQLQHAYDATIHLLAERGIDVYKPNPAYFPHLSLVYGDMKQDDREEIAAEMRRVLGGTPADAGFAFDEIQLWRTEPGDEELLSWTKILGVGLSNDDENSHA